MTVLERKAKFISAILTDSDEERFVEMEKFYKSLKKRKLEEDAPCMYTIEEVRARVLQQMKDLKAGKLEFIPHEQIERKIIP